MADTPTANWGLPRPEGTDLIADTDEYITELSEELDNVTKYLAGTFSARSGVSHVPGQYYWATDIGVLYLSDGTSWQEITPGPGSIPIGGLLAYGGSGEPADARYMLCDGRAVSRSTYATLFGVLGTAFGAGDGSTTFNIPDLRGRSAVGPDNMGTSAGAASRIASGAARGQGGGASTHTLATTEIPSHSHSPAPLNNLMNRDGQGTALFVVTVIVSGPGTIYDGVNLGFSNNYAGGSAGGGGAHNNLQPFQAVPWIVRVT